MTSPETSCRVFDAGDLIPSEWQAAAATGLVRTFNPGLLSDGDGWILAYRVVFADGRRRLALARLDSDLRVRPGSAYALSDRVRFPSGATYPEVVFRWQADPRLYRFGGRVFVYWNSGWHEPQNHQFLQELDGTTLAPRGAPRELLLQGPRRPLEKNWTLFAGAAGGLFAVYSVQPHRVLRFSLEGDGAIVFHEHSCRDWNLTVYPDCHGGLRGGAPPVWHDGRYWSICHSVHDGAAGFCYAAGVYCFSGDPGFAPLAEPRAPLDLAPAERKSRLGPRLNPAVDEVIYPCGAAWDGTRWMISHGINDERCAISLLPPAAVEASLRQLGA